MSIFEYGFMQRAFLVGILLAVITPLIGMTVVLKRMSMVGDALAHASLAGVAIGMLFGINPVAGAGGICVVAALAIEAIRRRLPRYSENAIAIVMSAGIGLAGVLSGFVKNSANFNSFLFGSIVSISTAELLGVCAVSAAVLLLLILFRKELFYIGFDENAARISGVPVRKVNFLFTVLTACTVSIASRTVGTLIISSMLVVPVAFGMQMGNSYRMTVLWSVLARSGQRFLDCLSRTIGEQNRVVQLYFWKSRALWQLLESKERRWDDDNTGLYRRRVSGQRKDETDRK